MVSQSVDSGAVLLMSDLSFAETENQRQREKLLLLSPAVIELELN